MFSLPEFKTGDRLKASVLMDIIREVLRLGKITAEPPLYVRDEAAGFNFCMRGQESWWITLSSAGTGSDVGKYAWSRIIPNPSMAGGWIASPGGESGTVASDPAYEVNGNGAVNLTTTPRVKAWREQMDNSLRFQAGTCS